MSDKPKKYWHRLSQEQQTEVFNEGISTERFWQRFKAPKWCSYHPSVEIFNHPPRICRSLFNERKVIGKKVNCSKCPFCTK